MNCNLCKSEIAEPCAKNKQREFYYCCKCELISVPEQYWLSHAEEKERYKKHNNSEKNHGYVAYLNEIVAIVKNIGKAAPEILDFGSGERAILTELLKKNGYNCTAYDPVFGKYLNKETNLFDIVILCEVIEHLRDITGELKTIRSLLKNNGVLIVRTRLYPSVEDIKGWWYTQDKTHINFFSKAAIENVAQISGLFNVIAKAEDIFVIY